MNGYKKTSITYVASVIKMTSKWSVRNLVDVSRIPFRMNPLRHPHSLSVFDLNRRTPARLPNDLSRSTTVCSNSKRQLNADAAMKISNVEKKTGLCGRDLRDGRALVSVCYTNY